MDNSYQIKQIENNNYHKVKTYTEAVVEKGISPYIGENGNWFEYDDELGKIVDTRIKARGDNGKSAYEVAVEEGFDGSVKSWLVSLKGADGISPTVETEQTETGATIYITDRLGVKSAIVKNGKDFTYDMFTPEQLNSLKGQDGYSPTVEVKQISNGARITITDKEQTTTTDIRNGKTPVKGIDYFTDSDIESIVNQTKSEITIPTKLSQLEEDSEHKTVSDSEIDNWNNKVDKAEGKELSSNDFTSQYKNMLDNTIKEIEVDKICTNFLINGIDESGQVLNGVGYILDKRFRSTGEIVDLAGDFITGYIAVQPNDILSFSNISFPINYITDVNNVNHYYYAKFYDDSFNMIHSSQEFPIDGDFIKNRTNDNEILKNITIGDNTQIAYIRLSGVYNVERSSDNRLFTTNFDTGYIHNNRIYQSGVGYEIKNTVIIPQIDNIQTDINNLDSRVAANEQDIETLKQGKSDTAIDKYKYQLDKALTMGYISSPSYIQGGLGLGKMLNFLHITDTHGSPNTENAVDILNYLGDNARCKFLIHTGDFHASTFADDFTKFQEYINNAKYPFMFISGNHDVGNNSKTYPQACTDEQLYNKCFKDNIPKWNLKSDTPKAGDYVNLLLTAIDSDGSTLEYIDGYRLSSTGTLKESATIYTTGFIKIEPQSTVYLKNVDFGIKVSNGVYSVVSTGERYIYFANSSFGSVSVAQIYQLLNNPTSNIIVEHTDNEDGTVTINSFTCSSNKAIYMRYCAPISLRTGEEIVSNTPIIDTESPTAEPHPDGKNYWYTDFTDEKVRLIGMYNFECDDTNSEVYNSETQTFANARGYAAYKQEQIDWFIDALLSTPNNYGVIVATHNPHNLRGKLDNPFNGIYLQGRNTSQTYVDKNMIPDIIQAFIDGTTINKTYTQTKGVIVNLVVNADFGKKNSGAEFICYLNGHTHADGVSFLQDYPAQLEINGNADNYHYQHYSDIYNQVNTLHQDAINYISVDRNRGYVYILRIGNDFTAFTGRRDFTAINYREQAAQKKSNEFELIENITLDSDVTYIDRNAEPNGTLYNFSALYLYMNIKPATNRSSLSVIANSTKNLCNQYSIIHDEEIYTYVYSKIINGYLDTVYPTNVYTFKNATATMNKANFSPETIFNVESINSIRIGAAKVSGDGDAYIPSGSSIQIWGVRQ